MKMKNEVKAGVFVLIGFVLVGALILVMGRERQIFASQSEYFSMFNDVKGLSAGAPVRMGGIPIGRVDKVGFSKTPGDMRVRVTLLINDTFVERIRPDSRVTIDTQGLLGDRFISISGGSLPTSLQPKSEIPATEVADLSQVLVRAQAVVDNTTQITDRINKSLEGLSPQTFENVASASQSIAEIFKAIKTEQGFMHRLIYSEADGKKIVDSLASSAKDISSMLQQVRTGSGILHGLIYTEGGDAAVTSLFKAAHSVAVASDSISRLLAATESGKGLVHDLIYTEVEPGVVAKRVEEVLISLAQTATNLKTATDALSRGTGTLGALILDPQLYDNLVEVTDSAKRSFVLRQAIRSSLNN
jgi:phospholipid/cholesterol/gamma-HCH transport system substrate-binding protein